MIMEWSWPVICQAARVEKLSQMKWMSSKRVTL